MSMPAETPAEVTTSPSSTNRASASTSTPSSASDSTALQCVAAGRPARSPAFAVDERAVADARHQRVARPLAEVLLESFVLEQLPDLPARVEEQVDGAEVGERDVRDHAQAVRARDRVGALGDEPHRDRPLVGGHPRPGRQHLVRAGEVELLDAVPDPDSDSEFVHAKSVPADAGDAGPAFAIFGHAHGRGGRRPGSAHLRLRDPVRGLRSRPQRHRVTVVRVPRRRGRRPPRANADRLRDRGAARPGCARSCGHDRRPGLELARGRSFRRARRGAAARALPRCADRLDLHRSVRARSRRAARRPSRDDALAVRRRAPTAVSRRRARPERPLRRRRDDHDLGGHRRRHRPVSAHRHVRLRRRRGGRRVAADADAAAPLGRAGAVRRHTGAAGARRRDRRAARVGGRAHPGRSVGRRPRTTRRA